MNDYPSKTPFVSSFILHPSSFRFPRLGTRSTQRGLKRRVVPATRWHRQWRNHMLNNLIESSSHTRELKRRGYFFLFTVAAYTLLFTAGGIASIYAYDAQLDEQETEITITFVPPAPVEAVSPVVPARPNQPLNSGNPRGPVPTAPVVYESASNPHTAPDKITTTGVTLP